MPSPWRTRLHVGAFAFSIDGSFTPALDVGRDSVETTAVPEPSPAVLLLGGFIALAWIRRGARRL